MVQLSGEIRVDLPITVSYRTLPTERWKPQWLEKAFIQPSMLLNEIEDNYIFMLLKLSDMGNTWIAFGHR